MAVDRDQIIPPEELLSAVEPPLDLGSCILSRPDIAGLVQQALTHFEGRRYFLSAWCIMPNHVHVAVSPVGQDQLSDILHSWKSYTSHQICKVMERSGPQWERESFDHLIRTPEALGYFIRYTENNPVAAGLCSHPRDWRYSSAGIGFRPSHSIQIINPRTTPFSPVKGRGELPHLYKESGTYFVTFRLADAVVYNKK